jgi:hypothetical protein
MLLFVALRSTWDIDLVSPKDCSGIVGRTMMFLAVLAVANADSKGGLGLIKSHRHKDSLLLSRSYKFALLLVPVIQR